MYGKMPKKTDAKKKAMPAELLAKFKSMPMRGQRTAKNMMAKTKNK